MVEKPPNTICKKNDLKDPPTRENSKCRSGQTIRATNYERPCATTRRTPPPHASSNTTCVNRIDLATHPPTRNDRGKDRDKHKDTQTVVKPRGLIQLGCEPSGVHQIRLRTQGCYPIRLGTQGCYSILLRTQGRYPMRLRTPKILLAFWETPRNYHPEASDLDHSL